MTVAADLLVVLRALAVVPIVWAIGGDDRPLAFTLFALAALSDAADGWLARRGGAPGGRGALIDPLADKVLVVGTAAALAVAGALPPALLALLAVRELAAAALRASAYRVQAHRPADAAGKIKTALEMCALAALIASRPPEDAGTAAVAVLWIAVAIGIVTLAQRRRSAASSP